MQEKETQQIPTNEVLEERKTYEKSWKTSQDSKVRTVDSIDTETFDVDLSQIEKTLERSDKGKRIVEKTPSKGKSLMVDTPRQLRKEVMVRNKRQQYSTKEEGMRELN